ncbi:MAG: 16S rRNA (adenine(1518)-N(6)/adenine(1519)-N(6))-dimethyltransferase RsmA [Nitrospirae bacterium]|nr:16S rRNA (adenine(1518)-N(6)/adenine(1519)-N(6))-dimethyltransferase RsmA [Nitrospirota bacterium]MCL5978566.1 16S rRNA (adenine(1518)-N(6)/adenine(1519)-N(6))-dimethyltransferase RsmA [Nitrospirota bacterium]
MPKKHLGQNFLFDPSILHRIVEASGVTKEDTVVEIGPGPGTLTKILAGAAKKVIAIELDYELYARLKDELNEFKNIELIHSDALKYPYEALEPFKVVANIPYYITTPIIFRLLDARKNLKSMTLTIQKEVAQRIAAKPDTKEYGVLSIAVQYYSKPELKFVIPKGAFRPVPKVDSAVIRIEILDKPAVAVNDEKLFFRVVKTSFAQRRKTLANSLKSISNDIKEILIAAGIDPRRRAETLSIEEFARLADLIKKAMPR